MDEQIVNTRHVEELARLMQLDLDGFDIEDSAEAARDGEEDACIFRLDTDEDADTYSFAFNCGITVIGNFSNSPSYVADYNDEEELYVDGDDALAVFVLEMERRLREMKSLILCTTTDNQQVPRAVLPLLGFRESERFINSNTRNGVTLWSVKKTEVERLLKEARDGIAKQKKAEG